MDNSIINKYHEKLLTFTFRLGHTEVRNNINYIHPISVVDECINCISFGDISEFKLSNTKTIVFDVKCIENKKIYRDHLWIQEDIYERYPNLKRETTVKVQGVFYGYPKGNSKIFTKFGIQVDEFFGIQVIELV